MMKSREKNLVLNSWMSILQQVVAVVCGLILPQLILKQYGSSVNGTIASITQFLSFITLLQGGVGTVARLAFYKPLAENDVEKISIAYKTVDVFYRKFANIFTIYLVVISVVYPLLVKTGFGYAYVCTLVLILGVGSAFEYFFGQASQMLLFSAQKNFIYSATQIVCTILSTLTGIVLLNLNAGIHTVKLASALIYAIRPILLSAIVKKKYRINKKVHADNSLLAQRNSAFIRHIAFYIHTSTDIMILTVFTNVLMVSVYSVHRYVTSSLSTFIQAILGNIEAIYGDMYASGQKSQMERQVPVYDLISKMITCSCFFTCIILISRFVAIYTNNVTDIDYYHPVFATVLILAEMVYCMGMTYQSVFIAAGHIKNTEWMAIGHAIINLGLSLLLVHPLGLLGVAIGTLVSSIFKTIVNIIYMNKNVLNIPTAFIIKSYVVNLGIGIFMTFLFWTVFYVKINSYFEFFCQGLLVFVVTFGVYVIANFLSFREEMEVVIRVMKRKLKRE